MTGAERTQLRLDLERDLLPTERTAMPYLTYTVGLGLWGQMRRFLRESQFRHEDIHWLESSGWIERTFTINAEATVLADIKRALDRWISELDGAQAHDRR